MVLIHGSLNKSTSLIVGFPKNHVLRIFIFFIFSHIQGCKETELSNEGEIPTFARTTPLNTDVTYMIIAMLRKYKWNKFAVMYEEERDPWNNMYKLFREEIDNLPDLMTTEVQGFKKSDSFITNIDSLTHIFEPSLNRLQRGEAGSNKKGNTTVVR